MENKIIERIELNTDAGKYIKCNNCGRLSPEQKYCKYCFNRLTEGGGAEVKSIYISRGRNYSPVSDFSRMREKIDSEFKTSEIDFASLGLTEEEYNLKYTPPAINTTKEEYRAEISERFDEAYRRYERQAVEAYKARQKEEQAAKKERESVKQIISDTPAQTIFAATAAQPVIDTVGDSAPPQAAEAKPARGLIDNQPLQGDPPQKTAAAESLTVRRQSSRFKLSFLSAACFVMNLLIIGTLFFELIGGASGIEVLSIIPALLGAEIENAWLTAAASNQTPFVIAAASYLLIAGLSLYQFFSFAVCVISDKKQKNYAEFVLSFTALLCGVILLFALLLSSFALTDFVTGTVLLLTATVIQFICATGKMLRD